MFKKIVFGMVLVLSVCVIAGAGYKFGRSLRATESASAALNVSPASGTVLARSAEARTFRA